MPEAPTPLRSYAGRFSLSTWAGERRENVAGRFALAVHRRGVTLDLVSPLGNTLARVQTEDGAATLTAPRADGSLEVVRGDSAESLAEQTLGWSLPVSGLPSWIEGRPVQGQPATVIPTTGPAESIVQEGWAIRILERFPDSPDPRLIEFSRALSETTPAVQLRVVLDGPGRSDAHR